MPGTRLRWSVPSLIAMTCGGCVAMMLPAIAMQDARHAARVQEARAAVGELAVGSMPPGGLDVWLTKHAGVVDLATDTNGHHTLIFPHSLCSVEASLTDGKVTGFTGCVEHCSSNARPVDCSWVRDVVVPK